jgi:SAM-dependent methyltransferase
MQRKIYYALSPKLRRVARKIYFFPSDIFDRITGKKDKLIPPKGSIFIGRGDFKSQGERLLKELIQYGNLQPHHRVLDVGCGIGRLAIPLTKYLNEKGSYEGFDIVKSAINWCQKNISAKHPNFRFVHIDLKNDLYNLRTENEAKNFIFPYKDNEFDLVFLFSVFSHMLPDDVDNYLKQIHRVLKKDGICLATFFILNNESTNYMEKSKGLKFKYDKGNYVLHDKKVKEANVAYYEDFLKNLFKKNTLKIETIHYGNWSGRPNENRTNFQDNVILKK